MGREGQRRPETVEGALAARSGACWLPEAILRFQINLEPSLLRENARRAVERRQEVRRPRPSLGRGSAEVRAVHASRGCKPIRDALKGSVAADSKCVAPPDSQNPLKSNAEFVLRLILSLQRDLNDQSTLLQPLLQYSIRPVLDPLSYSLDGAHQRQPSEKRVPATLMSNS